MSANQKIGLCLLILGVGMFIFGISMFSYQGSNLNPLISEAGMYSFFLWLPVIIAGIVFLISSRGRKRGL